METFGSKRSYALTWCMPNNDDDDDVRSVLESAWFGILNCLICATGSKYAVICSQLNLVPLLLMLLRDASIKTADQLQLLLTLHHCLDGNGLYSQSDFGQYTITHSASD